MIIDAIRIKQLLDKLDLIAKTKPHLTGCGGGDFDVATLERSIRLYCNVNQIDLLDNSSNGNLANPSNVNQVTHQ